jgi:putative effector of murein hydrolase LrgA (UPF0299 family)
MDRNAARLDNAARLHRRTVIGTILLFGTIILPVLLLIGWLNWSIVFRGADWARIDPANPGAPEIVVAMIAGVALLFLLRAFGRWVSDVVAAHLPRLAGRAHRDRD